QYIPFYNQALAERRNYTAGPKTNVLLPRLHHPARLNIPNTKNFDCSVRRPQTLMKPQNPPPRSSRQDGSKTLNVNRRSCKRSRRNTTLRQIPPQTTRGEADATTSRWKPWPSRRSGTGNKVADPEEEAHRGA